MVGEIHEIGAVGFVEEAKAVGAGGIIAGRPGEIGAVNFLGVGKIVIALGEEDGDEAMVEEIRAQSAEVEIEEEGVVDLFHGDALLDGKVSGGAITREKMLGISRRKIVAEAVGEFTLERGRGGGVVGERAGIIDQLEDEIRGAVAGVAVKDLVGHLGGLGPHFMVAAPAGEDHAAVDVVVLELTGAVEIGGEVLRGGVGGWGRRRSGRGSGLECGGDAGRGGLSGSSSGCQDERKARREDG